MFVNFNELVLYAALNDERLLAASSVSSAAVNDKLCRVGRAVTMVFDGLLFWFAGHVQPSRTGSQAKQTCLSDKEKWHCHGRKAKSTRKTNVSLDHYEEKN